MTTKTKNMKIIKNKLWAGTGISVAEYLPQFFDFEEHIRNFGERKIKMAAKQVNVLKIALDKTDNCLYADVEIVKLYLQKMVAYYDNIAENGMFVEINREICMYTQQHPYLTSEHLLNVLKFADIDPVKLYKQLTWLSAKKLAETTGVGHSRIRQLAESIPGGQLTDDGWRFPVSAIDFVKSLPGRGRPKKKSIG